MTRRRAALRRDKGGQGPVLHDRHMSSHDRWHEAAATEVARRHGVDPAQGLAPDEVAARQARHGANALTPRARAGPGALLLAQFTDFMVLVLVAAAVVSALVGELTDALVIVVIVVLNAVIGFVQAWRADQALAALQRLAAAQATVLRAGAVHAVPAHALVPGDVVLLEAGNQVPADLRLLHSARLQVDESALTGESATVDKHAEPLAAGSAGALGERLNMAYKGTIATAGRGRGIVVATGMATELGRIARLLDTDDRSTPLQRRLAAFGRRLALAVIAVCGVIFAAGLLRGEPVVPMGLTAISLAVAAIPEALPAVVTVLLALGARRLVEVHALVRRLPSVETLGSVDVICSDKTGTLTQNRMTVEQADGPEALEIAALCNDARHDGSRWQGDPTETALVEAAAAQGAHKTALDAAWPRIGERPFDAERKRMSTLHEGPAGRRLCMKGAPEAVLPCCEGVDRAAQLARADALAAQGLRVLATAVRDGGGLDERGLRFTGLVALIDPPRPEAAAAVAECRAAGITPVMITGDHPATARAIAARLGIAPADAPVLTGAELLALDDGALGARLAEVRVFARVDPAQKIRIVQALQAQEHFVAMTGDGVNDAPALKRADIGVAMGQGGTDVAREAASLVLLDDHFATIVAAVKEGRRIYDNIRKFVRYAMTGNSGEVWTLFLAPLAGMPLPLLPIHILWINLVTDGLPGLALAAEPAERGVMRRPPRPPRENLFAHGLGVHVLVFGLLMAGLALALQAWALAHAPALAATMVFTTLTFAQMAHVMAIRSEREPLWRIGLVSNRPLLGAVGLTVALQLAVVYWPPANRLLKTVPLPAEALALCVGAALLVGLAVEAEKAWRTRSSRPGPGAR